MSDLIQSDDRNATSMATNSENNAVRMAEAAMREQGQNARTQLQEQGQNSRFEASNDLDQRYRGCSGAGECRSEGECDGYDCVWQHCLYLWRFNDESDFDSSFGTA